MYGSGRVEMVCCLADRPMPSCVPRPSPANDCIAAAGMANVGTLNMDTLVSQANCVLRGVRIGAPISRKQRARANASSWIACVCFDARREVDGDKGIRTNAGEAAKIKPHLRVAAAASTAAAAHAALQKPRKCSTGQSGKTAWHSLQ
jgi:hypothetical protein